MKSWNELRGLKAHYTATGYVVTPDRKKMLLVSHKKLDRWLPPGGHISENELPHIAASREVREETGVEAFHVHESPIGNLPGDEYVLPNPYCMLCELIPANDSEPEHWHIDSIFLMEAAEVELSVEKTEVNDARWFSLDEIRSLKTFEGVIRIAETLLGRG